MKFLDYSLLEYPSLISNINREINTFYEAYRQRRGVSFFEHIYDDNHQIQLQIENLISQGLSSTRNIDLVLMNLSKEYVPIYNRRMPIMLEGKLTALRQATDNLNHKLLANLGLNEELQRWDRLCSKYRHAPTSCLIVVAEPIEFRAIYRKLNIILMAEDKFLFEVLEADKDDILEDDRKALWVEGIITRNDRFVKIAIQFLPSYGSLNSLKASLNYFERNPVIQELICLGIGGQMCEDNSVLIGDLVISTGIYNAYDGEGKVFYKNRKPIMLNTNSVSTVIDINSWKADCLIEDRPEILDSTKERESYVVREGLYVCAPGDSKDRKHKANILASFRDSLAIETEGIGCLMAIEDRNLEMRIIKGLKDWSDNTKRKDKEKEAQWQRYLADLSSEFCIDYLIAKHGNPIPKD